MELLSLVPLLNTITCSLLESNTKEEELERKERKLQRLFLLECQCNLKILDTTKWKNVSDDFVNEMIKHLRTDAAQAVQCFVREEQQSLFLQSFSTDLFSKEPSIEKDNNIPKIVSLIARIETLRILSGLPPELQRSNAAEYPIRIRNLRKLIANILSNTP